MIKIGGKYATMAMDRGSFQRPSCKNIELNVPSGILESRSVPKCWSLLDVLEFDFFCVNASHFVLQI